MTSFLLKVDSSSGRFNFFVVDIKLRHSMHVLVDALKNIGKVIDFVVYLILLAVLLQVFADEPEVIPGHAGEAVVLVMELQATVVPV